jgi:hypothetical protein
MKRFLVLAIGWLICSEVGVPVECSQNHSPIIKSYWCSGGFGATSLGEKVNVNFGKPAAKPIGNGMVGTATFSLVWSPGIHSIGIEMKDGSTQSAVRTVRSV